MVNASLGICPTTNLLGCMRSKMPICLVSPGRMHVTSKHTMRIVRGKTSRKVRRLGGVLLRVQSWAGSFCVYCRFGLEVSAGCYFGGLASCRGMRLRDV